MLLWLVKLLIAGHIKVSLSSPQWLDKILVLEKSLNLLCWFWKILEVCVYSATVLWNHYSHNILYFPFYHLVS